MQETFNEKIKRRLEVIDEDLDALLAVEGTITELQSLPEGLVNWVDSAKHGIKEFKKKIR